MWLINSFRVFTICNLPANNEKKKSSIIAIRLLPAYEHDFNPAVGFSSERNGGNHIR